LNDVTICHEASAEKSERGFSRNVRLTSNNDEFNPEFVMKAMRFNKFNHKLYNPTIVNKEWRKHF
jgi:hypothetical protein